MLKVAQYWEARAITQGASAAPETRRELIVSGSELPVNGDHLGFPCQHSGEPLLAQREPHHTAASLALAAMNAYTMRRTDSWLQPQPHRSRR